MIKEIKMKRILSCTALCCALTLGMAPAASYAEDFDLFQFMNCYNLIVLGDYNAKTDVEGRSFVGGNMDVASANLYILPEDTAQACAYPELLVVGDLSGSATSINNGGSMVVGGSVTNTVNLNGGGTSAVIGSLSGSVNGNGTVTESEFLTVTGITSSSSSVTETTGAEEVVCSTEVSGSAEATEAAGSTDATGSTEVTAGSTDATRSTEVTAGSTEATESTEVAAGSTEETGSTEVTAGSAETTESTEIIVGSTEQTRTSETTSVSSEVVTTARKSTCGRCSLRAEEKAELMAAEARARALEEENLAAGGITAEGENSVAGGIVTEGENSGVGGIAAEGENSEAGGIAAGGEGSVAGGITAEGENSGAGEVTAGGEGSVTGEASVECEDSAVGGIAAEGEGSVDGGTSTEVSSGTMPIEQAVRQETIALSERLADMAVTDEMTMKTENNTGQFIVTSGAETAVFEVSLDELSALTRVEVSTGSAEAVVINVTGASGNITMDFVPFEGQGDVKAAISDKVIWNFPDASELNFNKAFFGSVIATGAHGSNQSNINGTVVFESFTQGDEIHVPSYAGPAL